MLRCAILDDYQNVALSIADWSPLEGEVETTVFNDYLPDHAARVAALKDFDLIVAMRERTRFDAALLKELPRLRLLVTTGMYNASIDMAAAEEQGIVVCGTGGIPAPPAELAWGMILSFARNLPQEFADFRAGAKWQPRMSLDLAGRRLGIIGFGKLGSRVAKVGTAFNMDVVAWSRSLTDEKAEEEGISRAATLEWLLETSDFVTIHLPLNPSTRGLIGARELRLMKPTAFLINTSRGPIVDESALMEALNEHRLGGAGLDVFSQEPLPPDHPLRTTDRLLGTPHIGFVTEGGYRVFYGEAVEDIQAWLKGAPVRRVAARK